MKVAVFSTNTTFFPPLERAFRKAGCVVEYRPVLDEGLLEEADIVFFEFCQDPMWKVMEVLKKNPEPFVVARMHRIEMYSRQVADKAYNWGRVDLFLPSAEHVCERFLEKRSGASKPKGITIAATNVIDSSAFKYAIKGWEPPYRICLAGNFVPKKRQYSAIQMMYDVRHEFGDRFRLDIVGSRGQWAGYGNPEYFDNCMDLIEELGLKDVVTVFDAIGHDQMPAFLSREHILLSNSNEEGTHVVVAEAAMTGCVPFIGPWRGALKVYPPNVAWHFKSTGEFVDLCRKFDECGKAGELPGVSVTISGEAVRLYGDMEKYDRLVQVIMSEADKKRGKP